MDNSWQMKCSSTWQSLTSLMASSSQLQPLESRNQMLNAGHYLYPHVAQEPSSAARGMIQEPMFPKASNLNSYISGHAEMGSSFLSLLSGPPSLLQCNLQPFPKPFIASSKVPVDGSCSIMVSTAESKVLPPPAGPLSQDLRNQNPKVGADLCAVVSSRELISANYGTGLLSQNLRNQSPKIGADPCPVASSRRVASANCGSLQDVLQAANLNLQNSELSKAVIHHIVPGNEKVKDISSPMGNWLTGARPANVGKPHATNIQASQKFQLQMNSPLSHQSSTLTSGCPRVFCLGASGNLLLSNTGLLGVVCSCHGLHMSVSKFSEHSGLCDVNPGDAVYMDSGETIAQWRRLYFHKFGIRVPEDHSGWDWPEGFSATAGLVKHSATVPNMSKNSDAPNLNNTSGAFVGSGQSWNNVVIPKNPHTGQKLVNEVIHNEKQRNAQDSCNFLFKGLTGTSQSNLHPRADNQIVECPISGCSTMSKLAGIRGPDNGCQSISAYIDSISKSGNLITSHPNLQNSETPGKDFDFSRFSNSKEGDIVDRDTVPSNIELRLGQPSQQTRTLGNSCLPMFGSHLFDTIGDPQKSHFLEQLIHNTSNSVVMEECRQHLKHAADTSISNARREQSQFNNMNHGSGVNSITHAAKIEQFKGDEARGPVISMLLSHLKNSAEGKLHFKATNNLVNGNEHVMPRTPCESHTAKCESINFLRNRGDGTEKQSSINEIGLHKHMDKGKGLGSDANGSHVATESSFNFPTKHLENTSSFSAVAGGTGHHSSAIRDKNSHLYQFSGMSPDASDTRNAFNYFGKLSCLGHNGNLDNFFLRSISSPMDPGSVLPSQAVSMGFSATTSISVPSLTPALPNKDSIGLSPYLLDENMRRIACRHIMESYNQDPAISSFGTNQENGRFINSCGVKLQGSAVDPLMSKERVHGPNITGKQDISEVATKSIQSGVTWMSRDREKLAPVAGLNKWCDFSTFSQGPLLHSKEMETHCQLSRDPHAVEQSSLRSENNITSSSEHGKCCQRAPYTYFPGKCTCAVHTNCLVGDCDFKGKTSLDASRELAESVGGKASILFASKFNEDCSFPKEKVISLGHSGKLNWQIPKKVDCHGFQWRDVPSKVTGMCNVPCKDLPADLLDGRINVKDQITNRAANHFNRSAQEAESLKEQEISNISSGCSAPAVTQASMEVNNMDSCTAEVGDSGYANNQAIEEGSGIDKCWSSDDELDSERSAEYLGLTCKINSINEGSSKAIHNPSSRSLIEELRLRDSLGLMKVRNQIHSGSMIHGKTNQSQKFERGIKIEKRKRATKWKMLDASFPTSDLSSAHNGSPKCIGSAEWHSRSSKDMRMLFRPDKEISHNCACSVGSSFKRRRSALSSPKTIPSKRGLQRLYNHREVENDYQKQLKIDDCVEIPEVSVGKKFRLDRTGPTTKQLQMQEPNCTDAEITMKRNSVDCMITSLNQPVSVCKGKERPVVCGKFGIISNRDSLKQVKIVPLRKILKAARRCTVTESCDSRLTSMKDLMKTSLKASNGCLTKFSNLKKDRDSENHDTKVCTELDPDGFIKEKELACIAVGKECDDALHMPENKRYAGSEKNCSISGSYPSSRLKPKCKEIRKRSLHELTIKGKDSSSTDFSTKKISKCVAQRKSRYLGKFLENAEDGKCHVGEMYNANKSTKEYHCQSSILDLDTFCCVCGSSNKEETNCLLECSRCWIRVHQACYGVSKVPKAWYCRPCRTSSKNIVCVLCGYGGGAMTRALRSRNIVKSLLKAWKIVTESRPKNTISPCEALEDQLRIMNSKSGLQNDLYPVFRHVHVESSSTVWKMDLQKQLDSVKNLSCSSSNLKVDNSITAGILDSTVKQWVHMVCGLWTPGTRCPNVDTMSAFDVSGAFCPNGNVVCSMCNRPGGSCIQCRVVDCCVQFHPWCAHQKGLLQSEVEGVDNESVGFYGRCVLHATYHLCDSDGDPIDTETAHPGENESTCARTEGYKGRKREGFQHNPSCQSNGSGGCLVPQEQLNAWLHINGQKSCAKGLPKLPISDIEYDCRKEYTRYKQSKGWKRLVVYKSGIHALGLYTSRFIPRGAMVVEYVGEIVGLRVADKRESEYQSGRKLQYKSACYFFRIDKEHIIDATRKGGIARFVNHSCLPNCVAKVISVRNEKKVVFFAERDIYPGEEITYDYHFNHEDEGKKIPCFCNSKNCRRYLN